MEVESCEKGLLLEYLKKPSPPPFLLKTYMLVEDPATDEVISWNEEGKGFVVWQTAEFSRDLLPKLFKHSNFSSFVRQLNTYGFRKVATSRWEFSNEMFRKGEKELLCEIRRKKSWSGSSSSCSNKQPQQQQQQQQQQQPRTNARKEINKCGDEEQRYYSSSATSSSSEYNSVIDENKKLKKQNCVLTSKLSAMKIKCKELLHLLTIVAAKKQVQNDDDDDDKRRTTPKLFGVRLEAEEQIMERKRKRDEMITEIISQTTATVFLSQSCK